MNRRDLVATLAERLETDKRTADAHLQGFIDTITETVSKGEPVVISGFAKFARVDRAARMGRNPQTGAAIRIKASGARRVTPLKAFKDAVLSGKAPGQEGSRQEGSGQEGRAGEEGGRQEGRTGQEGRGQEGARQEGRGQEGRSGQEGNRRSQLAARRLRVRAPRRPRSRTRLGQALLVAGPQ